MPLPRLLPIFLCLLAGAASATAAPAEPFPKPNPEKAFPEFKIYDDAGRPWRIAREDWDGARQRIKEDSGWADWLKTERATVDTWMETAPKDRVEWAAGWSHDGVSPKDGSRIFWSPKIPGVDVPHLSTRSDPQVEITPKIFAWWVVTFRGQNVQMMVEAAQLYRLTGDTRYAEWAAGQMDFYADNFLKWQPARDGARLFWQTLTEATNVLRFAEIVRHLGDFVTGERKQRWRRQLFEPEVAVLNNSYRNVHNIAAAQRNAAAQVALLFGDDAMWREAVDGRWGIRTQIREGVTSDYLWAEQSLGYNGMVVGVIRSFVTAACLYGRGEQFAHEMAVAQNVMLSPTYYRFPNGQLPNPADNIGIPTAPAIESFASAYRVFPTTIGVAAIQGRRGWDTLLDPPPAWKRPTGSATAGNTAVAATTPQTAPTRSSDLEGLPEAVSATPPVADDARPSGRRSRRLGGATLAQLGVTLPPIVSRNLESSRMAILKDGPWQLFFHYGQLTRSHTESEALNFTAYYGETDLTHDVGTYAYGSPLHLGYFTRGLAHNALLVNGEGQDLGAFGERREWIVEEPDYTRPMRGELLEFSTNPARVTAAQPQYRRDASARRTLEIRGQSLIDTAVIEGKTDQPQKLGLALHIQGKTRLPTTLTPDANFTAGRGEPFSYWRDARSGTFRDRAEFVVDYGTVVMRVTIATPGEFKLWHADTPDLSPRRRESFYVELTGTRATFTTTFEPMPARTPAE